MSGTRRPRGSVAGKAPRGAPSHGSSTCATGAGARRHAKIAVQQCKADLKRFSDSVGDSNDVLKERVMNGETDSDVPAPREVEVSKTVSALAVACHNLAVETEFTQGGDRALGWYKRAAELVKVVNSDDPESMMKQKILESYFNAKRKYNPRQKSAGSGAKAVKSLRKSKSRTGKSNTAGSSTMFVGKTSQLTMPRTATEEYVTTTYASVKNAVTSRRREEEGADAPLVTIDSSNNEGADIPVEEDEASVELFLDQDMSSNESDGNTMNTTKSGNMSRPKSAGFERPFSNKSASEKQARPKTAVGTGRRGPAVSVFSTSSPNTPVRKPSDNIKSNYTMSPEQARDALVEKIEKMDNLAGEARRALLEIKSMNTPALSKQNISSQRRPKSAQPSTQTKISGTYQNPHTYTPSLPPYASELLATANQRNQTNVRKLIEQREEAKSLLLKKEAEIKDIRIKLKRLENDQKDKEDFDKRLVKGLQAKVDDFESDKEKLRSEYELRVVEVEKEMAALRLMNGVLAREKIQAEGSAAESRRKYISCCSDLAKEKLAKRVQEMKATKSLKMEHKAKGQKNLQMLVYKTTIGQLNQKLSEERAHSMDLEKHLRELHQKHSTLKKIDAKAKVSGSEWRFSDLQRSLL